MKNLFLIIFLLFITNSFSQVHNEKIIVPNGNGGIRIQNIQNKKVSISGSSYYDENWNMGKIILFSGEVFEELPLKYDLKMNQIDIKVDDEVKAISIGLVKEVNWTRGNGTMEVLRNSIIYDKNKHGLFTIINDGQIPLLKMTSLKLQEANYNVAMDVGSKARKWVKTESYYTIINGNIKRIKNNKRKVLKVFDKKAESVKEYANENNLSFKKDYDLAKIFDYYNSL